MVTHSKKKTWLSRLCWKEHSLRQENKCTLEWRMMDPWIFAPSIGSKYHLEARLQHDRDEHAEKASKAELNWRFEELIGAMVDISREVYGGLIGLVFFSKREFVSRLVQKQMKIWEYDCRWKDVCWCSWLAYRSYLRQESKEWTQMRGRRSKG